MSVGASPFICDRYSNPLEVLRNSDYNDESDSDVDKRNFTKIKRILVSQMHQNQQKICSEYQATYNLCNAHEDQYDDECADSNVEDKEQNFTELITYCLQGQSSKINKKKHSHFLTHCIQDLHTGYRAIDFAVIGGHLETIRKLLEFGAIPEVMQRDGLEDYIPTHSAIDL